MKKVLDYSVLVASGAIALKGGLEVFKAVKGKKYKGALWMGVGVAVAAYAFTHALNNIKPATKVVVVERTAEETKEGE